MAPPPRALSAHKRAPAVKRGWYGPNSHKRGPVPARGSEGCEWARHGGGGGAERETPGPNLRSGLAGFGRGLASPGPMDSDGARTRREMAPPRARIGSVGKELLGCSKCSGVNARARAKLRLSSRAPESKDTPARSYDRTRARTHVHTPNVFCSLGTTQAPSQAKSQLGVNHRRNICAGQTC